MKKILLLFIPLLSIGIADAQNVGIGTTTPSAKLHVGGGTRYGVADIGSIFLQSGTGGSGAARDWKIYVPMTAGNLAFRDMGFDNLNNGMPNDAMVIQYGTGNVGIGTTNPNAAAALDVSSTTKGILPPRMDSTQRNAIVSPPTGLTIYNTSINAFQCFNGTNWYSTVHFIGERYGGGIVFYIYDNGQHGLIAATTDQSTAIRWYGGIYSNTRARADGVGAGLKNTAIIIANQGAVDGNAFAATICNEYTVTVNAVTYADWYLPSKYELNLLYLQKSLVGGFVSGSYWSSTENDISNTWFEDFGTGNQAFGNKASNPPVRAIRQF